ncbi:MAG: SGNH/GDSL hydrolase family protein [Planctomycetota bacterium]|jgi:lysophospholipase L1-like esterase
MAHSESRTLVRRRKRAFVLGASLLSCTFFLILLELGLRVVQPIPLRLQGDRVHLFRNTQFTFDETPPWASGPILHRKNLLGFRGPDPPQAFADSRTILTVGGSTTECFYVSDDLTWPALLADKLSTHFPKLWLNNAGLDGHSTCGHLALLQQYIVEIKPDVVVFLVGINEVGNKNVPNRYDNGLLAGFTGLPEDPLWRKSIKRGAGYSHIFAIADTLLRYRDAKDLDVVHDKLGHSTQPLTEEYRTIPVEVRARQIAEQRQIADEYYRYRLQLMVDLCQKYDIRPVLVTQPALYGGGIDPATGVDLGRISLSEGENGRLRWEILQEYNNITRQVAQEANCSLIDLAASLPKDSTLYYDFIHFNEAGCRAVADVLYEPLREILTDVEP